MTPLTTPFRRAVALLALSALLLSLAAPVASAAPKCFDLRGGGTVCYDTAGPCAWATQFDAATDFGTIEKACVTRSSSGDADVACAETIAGAGTYGGFFGHYQKTCAATWVTPGGDVCVIAWGNVQGGEWQMVSPACVHLFEPVTLA